MEEQIKGILVTQEKDYVRLIEPELGTVLVKTKPPQYKVVDYRTIDEALKELRDLYQSLYLVPLLNFPYITCIKVSKQDDALYNLLFKGGLGSNKIQSITASGTNARITPITNTTTIQIWFSQGFANLLPVFTEAMLPTEQATIQTMDYTVVNIRSFKDLYILVCLLKNFMK